MIKLILTTIISNLLNLLILSTNILVIIKILPVKYITKFLNKNQISNIIYYIFNHLYNFQFNNEGIIYLKY